MATVEVQEIRATSYVGFDTITQQIEHKLLKRGFQFNVIVVGPSVSHSWCIYATRVFFNSIFRSNWSGKVDSHQHHIRLTPHRLEGQTRG
jgi:septin family protein